MFKALSLENFYNILHFDQAHVDHWLVKYSIQNEEIHQALCNLSIDFWELENDIFNIKIRDEINVALMRSYIQEWLERQLKQVTDERQHVVANIPTIVQVIFEIAVVDDINEMTTKRK